MCSIPVNCKSCLMQELLDLPAWLGPDMDCKREHQHFHGNGLLQMLQALGGLWLGTMRLRKKSDQKHFFCTHLSAQVALVREVLLKAAENSSICKIALYLIYVRFFTPQPENPFQVSAFN